MNDDDKTMLALAALTYRGFGMHSEAAVDRALRPWMTGLESEGLGRWSLVWGPATFHAPASLFDDAMVYVAREDRPAGQQARYAVAIRGTNPVSAFDWVFGDLWVRLQVAWTSGLPATGNISASTALGLAIIQHLAAETPSTGSGRLASLVALLASTMQQFGSSLPELNPAAILGAPVALPDPALIARVSSLAGVLEESRRTADSLRRGVLDKILSHIQLAQGPGETLMQFLNRAVAPESIVCVTGHSKGGALAVAAALWLEEQWAPAKQANVRCFSFAGPTAGDGAFAHHYDARLAARTRRIVNRMDIVPQAWAPEDLRSVPQFYPLLTPAVAGLTKLIAPLNYTHVGGELVTTSPSRRGGSLAAELVHQHLDAYLIDAGFRGNQWNARSIFLDP